VIDQFGNDLRYDYTPWGAPAHLYRPGSITESWSYDSDGNLSVNGITNGSSAPLKYPQNPLRATTFGYDGRGKIVTGTDPSGFRDTLSVTYSDLGYLQNSSLVQTSILLNTPGIPPTSSRYHSIDTYTNDGLGNVVGGATRDSTFIGSPPSLARWTFANHVSTFQASTGRVTAIDAVERLRAFTRGGRTD
jgi:hypothetical protein